MSDSLATPWTVACQAPLFMGFPRQGYCSGLPFPSPGDLPDAGIEFMYPALIGRWILYCSAPRESSVKTRTGLTAFDYLWLLFCYFPD